MDNGMIIHTAKVTCELSGMTSCGQARRVIERHLTPEQRERVLAQEARWEAFQEEQTRQAFLAEIDPPPLCLGGDEW